MPASPDPDTPDTAGTSDDAPGPGADENRPGPRPPWRYALWAAGLTLLGVGFGWFHAVADSSFPESYTMPRAVPGHIRPYLLVWTATGLTAAGALRAVAARVPLYAPEVPVVAVVFLGTRISLGYRPEPPALTAAVVAVLTATALWCAIALRRGSRRHRGQARRTGPGEPG